MNGRADDDGVIAAARLLHDFSVEHDEPPPPPGELAVRLADLVRGDHVMVCSPGRATPASRSG